MPDWMMLKPTEHLDIFGAGGNGVVTELVAVIAIVTMFSMAGIALGKLRARWGV